MFNKIQEWKEIIEDEDIKKEKVEEAAISNKINMEY